MNKYELAVVLSAKLEDDERTAALEKVKGYITRFGGTVTDVDEWGKKKLAYEIQKMKEGFYYFIHFEGDSNCPNEVPWPLPDIRWPLTGEAEEARTETRVRLRILSIS